MQNTLLLMISKWYDDSTFRNGAQLHIGAREQSLVLLLPGAGCGLGGGGPGLDGAGAGRQVDEAARGEDEAGQREHGVPLAQAAAARHLADYHRGQEARDLKYHE